MLRQNSQERRDELFNSSRRSCFSQSQSQAQAQAQSQAQSQSHSQSQSQLKNE